MYNQRMKL